MAYRILSGAAVVYDSRTPEYAVLDPTVRLAVNEPGRLSFTIPPGHPAAGLLRPRGKDPVLLMDDDECLLRGQVIRVDHLFDNSTRYEVEGELAALNDAVLDPFVYPDDWGGPEGEDDPRNTVGFYLQSVVRQAALQTGRFIGVGTVTVTDPNNYIRRASSRPMTCWDAAKRKLLDTLGGYLVAEYREDRTVIHYYAELPKVEGSQEIAYGINLTGLEEETDTTRQCTGVYPVGKDGVNLSSLPDGYLGGGYRKVGTLLYSTTLEDTDGVTRAIRTLEWPNVTDPNHLQAKALAWLKREGVKQRRTLHVTAADLGKPHFRAGQQVRLVSPPHGYDLWLPVMAVSPDLDDQTRTELTLDRETLTFTGQQTQGHADLEEGLEQASLTLPIAVTPVSGSGYTAELSRRVNGRQVIGYGLAVLQAGIKLTVTQTIKAGAELLVGRVGYDARPAYNAAAAVSIKSTKERRYIGYIETSGDIVLRPDLDMPPADYIFYVGSTYFVKE